MPLTAVLRGLRRTLVGLAVALVLGLALATLAARLLLPQLDHHPERVARALGAWLHQPVEIDAVEARWRARGPRLRVSGLRVGTGPDALALPRAELRVDLLPWLRREQRLLELAVRDVDVLLEADAQRQWRLSGLRLGGAQQTRSGLPDRLPLGLLLQDLRVEIRDPARGLEREVRLPAVRVTSGGGEIRARGSLNVSGAGGNARVIAAFSGDGAGRLQMDADALRLGGWARLAPHAPVRLAGGHGGVRLWLEWRAARVTRVSARLDLADLALERTDADTARAELPRFAGLLQLQEASGGWRGRWTPRADAGQDSGRVDLLRTDSGALQVAVRDLDLAPLAPLLALLPDADGLQTRLAALRPRGQLRRADLAWRSADAFAVRASIAGLGWDAVPELPQVQRLDATLRGDAQALSLELPAQPLDFAWPGVFRDTFVLKRVQGGASAWRDAGGWHLASDALDLEADDFAVAARGGFHQDGERRLPVLDITAQARDATVPAAKLFWPVNVMPERAVEWLDAALTAGDVEGRVLFRGNLGDWPFPDGEGRFEAVGDFADAELDYDPDWPRAEALTGQARFINKAMHISTRAGTSLGNATRAAQADIENLETPDLHLAVSGAGPVAPLLTWLRRSPVGAEYAAGLDEFSATGHAAWDLDLQLPLDADLTAAPRLDGHVQLSGSRFRAPEWSFAVDDLTGRVDFDAGGVSGEALTANWHEQPVQLGFRIGTAARQARTTLEASMSGALTAASLGADYPELRPLADVLAGTARFDVGLRVPDAGQDEARSRLSIDSDLVGMTLHLPPPLDKPAAQARHLHVDLDLPRAGSNVRIRLGQELDAHLRLAGGPLDAAAAVGLRTDAGIPPARGTHIHGRTGHLDAGAWLTWLLGSTAAETGVLDLTPVTVDLAADALLVDGEDLGPLAVRVDVAAAGVNVALDGAAAAGSIEVPLAESRRRGVTVRLDHLHWPGGAEDDASAADAEPLPPLVAPGALPPLHVWVRDLHVGAMRLGDVRLETVAREDGMQIDQFEAQSPDLRISARGHWRDEPDGSRSRFTIDLTAPDLGRMLEAFGYPRLVAGGNTVAHVAGSWPGSPAGFNLARLEGELSLRVVDGRILEVEPGMGRLIGLFSIRELPRRLSLDFGDIFQSGYSFNSITGELRFEGGNAWSESLRMEGPAADISMHGRTGLAARDYDEMITVTPHLGVAFPLVGALTGGPVGAAAGLAVQGILGKGVNRAGAAYYRVTGSWDDPRIERLVQPRSAGPAPARADTPEQ